MIYKLNESQFREWQQYSIDIQEDLYKNKAGFMNEYDGKDTFTVYFHDCEVSQEVQDFFEKNLDLQPEIS